MQTCAFCAEQIPATAVVCPLCKERLDGRSTVPDDPLLPRADLGRVEAKAAAIRDGRLPGGPPGPGKISAWTIVWFVPTALFAAGAAFTDDADGATGFAVFSAIFGIFFGLALLLDLTVVPPKARTTPDLAVRAFYDGIRRRRYRRAYACLSPLDRTPGRRTTAPIPTLAVESRFIGFESARTFGKYWRAQAGLDDRFIGGYHKHLTYRILNVEQAQSDLARVTVELRVKGYPSATGCLFLVLGIFVVLVMFLLTKEQVFVVEKLVYERDGLWWMLDGQLGDADDRAL